MTLGTTFTGEILKALPKLCCSTESSVTAQGPEPGDGAAGAIASGGGEGQSPPLLSLIVGTLKAQGPTGPKEPWGLYKAIKALVRSLMLI